MYNKGLWSKFINIFFFLFGKISKEAPNFRPATVVLSLNAATSIFPKILKLIKFEPYSPISAKFKKRNVFFAKTKLPL